MNKRREEQETMTKRVLAERSMAAGWEKSVDATVARVEAREAGAMRDAQMLRNDREAVARGADAIVSARMLEAGLQPRTAARGALEPHVVEYLAIETGADGATKVHRSQVTALFNGAQSPALRLLKLGLIETSGAAAAVAFAAAGDRVMGAVRVKTMRFDKVWAFGASISMADGERDALARQRWAIAGQVLTRSEFRIIDGVMRHDETAEAAARAAYPRLRGRDKVSGMGDQAMISACEALAIAYGLEPRPQMRALR